MMVAFIFIFQVAKALSLGFMPNAEKVIFLTSILSPRLRGEGEIKETEEPSKEGTKNLG
jgi:hypothetical protein